MQLPVDEEDNKQMMRVPEPLKVLSSALFHCEPDDDRQASEHNPTSNTWASSKICHEEAFDACPGGRAEAGEVIHVRHGVEKGEESDRPAYRFVESDTEDEIVSSIRLMSVYLTLHQTE